MLEGPDRDRQLSTLRPALGHDASCIGNLVIPCDSLEFHHYREFDRGFAQHLHARELGESRKVTPVIAPATSTKVVEKGLGILFEHTTGGILKFIDAGETGALEQPDRVRWKIKRLGPSPAHLS